MCKNRRENEFKPTAAVALLPAVDKNKGKKKIQYNDGKEPKRQERETETETILP